MWTYGVALLGDEVVVREEEQRSGEGGGGGERIRVEVCYLDSAEVLW